MAAENGKSLRVSLTVSGASFEAEGPRARFESCMSNSGIRCWISRPQPQS